jgi:uncharacterized membrane protein
MSTTFAPSAWPSPVPLSSGAPWRFARELPPTASAAERPALQWLMARHGSYSGAPMLAVYAALCAPVLGIGGAFWWLGGPAVLPLAGLELLALGAALWVCSRHVADAETITLAARELRVEHRCGRAVQRAAIRAEWVRVEPEHGERSLVELSGQGQRVRVGRYVRPEQRMALARELRLALRRECSRPAAGGGTLEQQR